MRDWTLITFSYTVQSPIRFWVCVLLAACWNLQTHTHTHTRTHTHTHPPLCPLWSGFTRLVRRQGQCLCVCVCVCVFIYLPHSTFAALSPSVWPWGTCAPKHTRSLYTYVHTNIKYWQNLCPHTHKHSPSNFQDTHVDTHCVQRHTHVHSETPRGLPLALR